MASQLAFFDNIQNSSGFPLLDNYFATLKASLSHCADHDYHFFVVQSFEHKGLLQSFFNPKRWLWWSRTLFLQHHFY
jgi:hypothetical protein